MNSVYSLTGIYYVAGIVDEDNNDIQYLAGKAGKVGSIDEAAIFRKLGNLKNSYIVKHAISEGEKITYFSVNVGMIDITEVL